MRVVDITGKKFGRLTAIAPTDKRDNGGVVWRCLCDCGNIAFVRGTRLRFGTTKSCGCIVKERVKSMGRGFIGPRNPAWKGKPKCLDGDGYVRIYVPNGRRIPEHRYIIEKEFGRKLKPDEVIHHLNGIRWDNRRKNLKYFPTQREHRLYHYLVYRLMFLLMRHLINRLLALNPTRGGR